MEARVNDRSRPPLASKVVTDLKRIEWAKIPSSPANAVTSHPDYGLDAAVNLKLLDSDSQPGIVEDDDTKELRAAWSWMEDMSTASQTSGLTVSSLNLAYVGIYPIWSSTIPDSPAFRLLSPSTSTSASEVSSALSTLLSRHSLPSYPAHNSAVPTVYPIHRAICLALNQTSLTPSTLPSHISTLPPTRAALYAYVHSDTSLAISTLHSAGPLHSGLAIALAASSPSQPQNPTFSAAVSAAASSSTDQYTIALLSHLSTGSWAYLFDESSIPLQDKLLVALTTLSDSALNTHLSSVLESSSTEGNLSALPLHGLVPSILPLFTSYIARSNDLATVTLLLTHSPLLSLSPPFKAWRALYIEFLLQNHQLHKLARLTSQATAISSFQITPATSAALDGVALTHLAIRCLRCDVPLSLPHSPAPNVPYLPTQQSSQVQAQAQSQSAPSPLATSFSSSHQSQPSHDRSASAMTANVRTRLTPSRSSGLTESSTIPVSARPPKKRNMMRDLPGRCTSCGALWPRCGVCRGLLGGRSGYASSRSELGSRIVNHDREHDVDTENNAKHGSEEERRALMHCLDCGHGVHGRCGAAWFENAGRVECSVPECGCECAG